jgi:hypothetical protein
MHHFAAPLQSAATAVCIDPDRCETLRILQNRCNVAANSGNIAAMRSVVQHSSGDLKRFLAFQIDFVNRFSASQIAQNCSESHRIAQNRFAAVAAICSIDHGCKSLHSFDWLQIDIGRSESLNIA